MLWGYLVHYADFPETSDEKISQPLSLPAAFSGLGSRWVYLTLTPGQARHKNTALHAYTSQKALPGQLLTSFAGQDEIFFSLPLSMPTRTVL